MKELGKGGPVICILPARYGSTRLHAKMLREIEGIPLVVWSYRNAVDSGAFDDVYVACDDERIAQTVRNHGGKALMTSVHHASGTDRVREACKSLECSYVVNLQADEPAIPAEVLRDFSLHIKKLTNFTLLTCVSYATIEEIQRPDVVKVVINKEQQALYFSRSVIPYLRDSVPWNYLKHTGIYGFTKSGLEHFCSLGIGALERAEKLEQLRALEHGMTIQCLIHTYQSISIDTEQDVETFKCYRQMQRKAVIS